MYSAVKVSGSFVLLNVFYQSCSVVQNHPYVIAFQRKILHIGNLLSHIFQKYVVEENTTIIGIPSSTKEPSIPFESTNEKNYVDPSIFVILGVLFFTWSICSYVKKVKKNQRNNETSPKVVSNQAFKKEDSEKLKEIHKILQVLKHQLTSPPRPSKIPRLYTLHSAKDSTKQTLPAKNQLSNASRRQDVERKVRTEELRHNLQVALKLLEEEMIDNKSTPGENSRNQEINTSVVLFDHNDDPLSITESQWNQINAQDEIEDRNMEEWIRNFENDGTILSATNENVNTKISHLSEPKYLETSEKYAKHQILSAARNGNFGYYRNYSPRDNKKVKRPTKSLYSNTASLPNSRNLINEDLKGNFKTALQLLDKDTAVDETDETPKHYQEDMSGWNVDAGDRTFYEHENERNKIGANSFKLYSGLDQRNEAEKGKRAGRCFTPITEEISGKQDSFHDVKRNSGREVCVECLKEKEGLSHSYRQIDYKEITGRRMVKEAKDKSLCVRCSKFHDLEPFTQDMNLNNLQPISTGNRSTSVERTVTTAKTKDNYNVSAKKNALSIEILFNRGIRLAK